MPTQLAQPSPKRKRDHPPPVPLLNTALAIRPAPTPPRNSPPPSGDADSPRTAVADQLRDMNLAWTAAIPMSPLTPTDNGVHKKPKLDAMRVDSGTSLNTAVRNERAILPKIDNTLDSIAVMPKFAASREIPETPQSSQPRMLPDIASFAQPTTFISAPTASTMHQSEFTNHMSQKSTSSHASPRARKSLSPPPSALTWKDSEITGHLAGPSTDPDDDGTGLNGIGFKPTPALAYARSQKRRQQLSEWKLREVREARAKRSERRRRGIQGTPSRETTVERELPPKQIDGSKRTVKFAV
ncbi:hypothetical protein T440DRAFT_467901 [Plenodomus tracheiphilus IPT5]|uniref:Uncharacterized protein n=1 Tax=Plenodomus tracheiphilus IPT5 TaxID=1408161 RepID=A0A6A7BAE3_9PLEO|nr:hypothetical protein T440DRAFT_467901 [Plenodomus tracheiphilus IPT5]